MLWRSPGAAAADHLVVNQIGRHPDQRQIREPLPDDLVAGRDRNQVSEALERHAVARTDEAGPRLRQWQEFGQAQS